MRIDALRSRALEEAEKVRAKRAVDVDYVQRMLARAKVDAERLTNSRHWNVYLEQVEALNELDCRALESLQAELESPEYRSAEQCQKMQFDCQLLIAKIQARNECIEIPKRIQGAADTGRS